MEKYYQFAGLELAVDIPNERMYEDDRQLAPFRVGSVRNPHRFHFAIVERLPEPDGTEIVATPGFQVYQKGAGTVRYIGSVGSSWENAYIRAEHQGMVHTVQLKASQFPDRVGMKTVLNAMEAEHLVLQSGGVIFHSSYIEWNGKAILFTAPSQTGKSTQAELWRELRGAEIINGDRSALQIVDGSVYAAGIPFAGSSQYCKNKVLPLAAIVYLQQAPVTEIRRIRAAQAFRRVWEGVSVNTWDKADVHLASDLVEQAVGKVPVFQLACTPDESAVLALEWELRKQENL